MSTSVSSISAQLSSGLQCLFLIVINSYDQGRIACANVLSDLYAMGVVDCHNMLMLLAGDLDDDCDLDDDDDNDNEDNDDPLLHSGQRDD